MNHGFVHDKIVIAAYYENPEKEYIVNLCRDRSSTQYNITLRSAKMRFTRMASDCGFLPIGNWEYVELTNDWKRKFSDGKKVMIGMVHLFEGIVIPV